MKRRIASTISVAAVVFFSLASVSVASAEEAVCNPGEAFTVEDVSAIQDVSCDLTGEVFEFDSGQSIVIPDAGYTVLNEVLIEEGSEYVPEVALTYTDSGTLAIAIDDAYQGEEGAIDALAEDLTGTGGTTGVVTSTKCSSSAPYSLQGAYSTRGYTWRYNSSGSPSTSALTRIQAAAATIGAGSSSTCGVYSNNLTVTYGGTTSVFASVNASSQCTGSDGQNTVSWGAITKADTLATACQYIGGSNRAIEADIRMDISSRSWNFSASCSSGIDLQGVMTHEFGHAVGLKHVAQASQQVMKPQTSTCDVGQRQLGRGDQRGLRDLYDF